MLNPLPYGLIVQAVETIMAKSGCHGMYRIHPQHLVHYLKQGSHAFDKFDQESRNRISEVLASYAATGSFDLARVIERDLWLLEMEESVR